MMFFNVDLKQQNLIMINTKEIQNNQKLLNAKMS